VLNLRFSDFGNNVVGSCEKNSAGADTGPLSEHRIRLQFQILPFQPRIYRVAQLYAVCCVAELYADFSFRFSVFRRTLDAMANNGVNNRD